MITCGDADQDIVMIMTDKSVLPMKKGNSIVQKNHEIFDGKPSLV